MKFSSKLLFVVFYYLLQLNQVIGINPKIEIKSNDLRLFENQILEKLSQNSRQINERNSMERRAQSVSTSEDYPTGYLYRQFYDDFTCNGVETYSEGLSYDLCIVSNYSLPLSNQFKCNGEILTLFTFANQNCTGTPTDQETFYDFIGEVCELPDNTFYGSSFNYLCSNGTIPPVAVNSVVNRLFEGNSSKSCRNTADQIYFEAYSIDYCFHNSNESVHFNCVNYSTPIYFDFGFNSSECKGVSTECISSTACRLDGGNYTEECFYNANNYYGYYSDDFPFNPYYFENYSYYAFNYSYYYYNDSYYYDDDYFSSYYYPFYASSVGSNENDDSSSSYYDSTTVESEFFDSMCFYPSPVSSPTSFPTYSQYSQGFFYQQFYSGSNCNASSETYSNGKALNHCLLYNTTGQPLGSIIYACDGVSVSYLKYSTLDCTGDYIEEFGDINTCTAVPSEDQTVGRSYQLQCSSEYAYLPVFVDSVVSRSFEGADSRSCNTFVSAFEAHSTHYCFEDDSEDASTYYKCSKDGSEYIPEFFRYPVENCQNKADLFRINSSCIVEGEATFTFIDSQVRNDTDYYYFLDSYPKANPDNFTRVDLNVSYSQTSCYIAKFPTYSPTAVPSSISPTAVPSSVSPTVVPTLTPSAVTSANPSGIPTIYPTFQPSNATVITSSSSSGLSKSTIVYTSCFSAIAAVVLVAAVYTYYIRFILKDKALNNPRVTETELNQSPVKASKNPMFGVDKVGNN